MGGYLNPETSIFFKVPLYERRIIRMLPDSAFTFSGMILRITEEATENKIFFLVRYRVVLYMLLRPYRIPFVKEKIIME